MPETKGKEGEKREGVDHRGGVKLGWDSLVCIEIPFCWGGESGMQD